MYPVPRTPVPQSTGGLVHSQLVLSCRGDKVEGRVVRSPPRRYFFLVQVEGESGGEQGPSAPVSPPSRPINCRAVVLVSVEKNGQGPKTEKIAEGVFSAVGGGKLPAFGQVC